MDQAVFNDAIEQARFKIYRAQCHFDEAREVFDEYVTGDFCKLQCETRENPLSQIFSVVAEPLPADLVLAVGDAFHNLNAAMDYVMTGMMRAGGHSTKRVSFPTNESREQLRRSFLKPKPGKKSSANRAIVVNFPRLVMALFSTLKPYPGGAFRLWEVTKADNIDKHNLIIPTVTITELRGVHLVDKARNSNVRGNLKIGPGGVLYFMENTGNGILEVHSRGEPVAHISFHKTSEVFAEAPLFSTLQDCIERIERSVDLIATGDFLRFRKKEAKVVEQG